jgi:DNA-binding CsgD family transcriptional regulator
MKAALCAMLWAFTPLIVIIAVVYWLSETQPQRIRRWHRQGHTQREIAERLGITRYRVRQVLS